MLYNSSGNTFMAAFMGMKYGELKVRDDERNKVGVISKGTDCMRLMRAYKQGKDKTFTQGAKGFNYFYAVVIHWEGYNEELQESENDPEHYDIYEMVGDEVYDFILNYYEQSPDENVKVIEWDEEVEQEEGTLPHDMKKDLCMNGYYYGTANKKMYESLGVGATEAQI